MNIDTVCTCTVDGALV